MKQTRSTSTPELSETQAVGMAKRGDAAGYEALYHLHRGRIYSLCLRHTKSVPDAEDLTQDVFMQAFSNVGSFRGDAAFGTWVYRIALNCVLMYMRRRRYDQVELTTVPERRLYPITPGSRIPAEGLAVRRAIDSLSIAGKNVLVLHDITGFSHEEVARRLGVTVGASKSQLHRARVALRSILDHGDANNQGAGSVQEPSEESTRHSMADKATTALRCASGEDDL